MHTRTIPVFLLVGTFILSGYSRDDNFYFTKLKDGLKWEYVIDYRVAQGVVQKGRMSYRIDGIDDNIWISFFMEVIVIDGIPGVHTIHRYVRHTTEGRYVIEKDDPSKTEFLEYPNPIEVGDRWTAISPTQGEFQFYAEAIETLYLFDTKYEDCLKVSFTFPDWQGYAYMAPGLGDVKIVAEYEDGSVIMEATLVQK